MQNVITHTGTVRNLGSIGKDRNGNNKYRFELTTAKGTTVTFRTRANCSYVMELRNAASRKQVVTAGVGKCYGIDTLAWFHVNDYARGDA